MKQVEFFKSPKVWDIRKQVNDFLASKKYEEIIDVQMTNYRNIMDTDSIVVMVTYRTNAV